MAASSSCSTTTASGAPPPRAASAPIRLSGPARWLANHDLSCLDKETTYLAEAIYPENRIVVHYQHAGLVLLGARATAPNWATTICWAWAIGWVGGWRSGTRSRPSQSCWP